MEPKVCVCVCVKTVRPHRTEIMQSSTANWTKEEMKNWKLHASKTAENGKLHRNAHETIFFSDE